MKFFKMCAAALVGVGFSTSVYAQSYPYRLLADTTPKIAANQVGDATNGITNRSVIVNSGAAASIVLADLAKWEPLCGYNFCTPYTLQLGNVTHGGSTEIPGTVTFLYTGPSGNRGILHFFNGGNLFIDGATVVLQNDYAAGPDKFSIIDIDDTGDFQMHSGTLSLLNGSSNPSKGAGLSVVGSGLMAFGTDYTGSKSITVNISSNSYVMHQGSGYLEIGGGNTNPVFNITGGILGAGPGRTIDSSVLPDADTAGTAEFDIKGGTFNMSGNAAITHTGTGGFYIAGGTFNMSGTSYVGRGLYDTAGNQLVNNLAQNQDLVLLKGAIFYLRGDSGIVNGSVGGYVMNGWPYNSPKDGASIIAYDTNEITGGFLDLGGQIVSQNAGSILTLNSIEGEAYIWGEISGAGTHAFRDGTLTGGIDVHLLAGSLVSSGWTWNTSDLDLTNYSVNNHTRFTNGTGGTITFDADSTLLIGANVSQDTTLTTTKYPTQASLPSGIKIGQSSYLEIGGGTVTIDPGAYLDIAYTAVDPTMDYVVVKLDAGTTFTGTEWEIDNKTFKTSLLYTVLWNQLDDPELVTIRILGINIDGLNGFMDENIVELVRGFKEGIGNADVYKLIADLASKTADDKVLERMLYELTAEGYNGIFNTTLITQQNVNNMMMHSMMDMRTSRMRYGRELRPDYYQNVKTSPCGYPKCGDLRQYNTRYTYRDMSAWAKAYYSSMSQDERPGKPGRRWGYDYDSMAVMGGIDRMYDEITFGIAGVIGKGDYEQQEMLTFEGDVEFYGIMPYASIIDGDWVNDFMLSWIHHDASTKRYISLYDITAKADYGLDAFGAAWTSNYVYRDGLMTWVPHFGLEYTYVKQESFDETNGGLAGYHVKSHDYDSLKSVIGLRWMYDWKKRLKPELKVQWKHDFLHERSVQEVHFLTNPNSVFKAWGSEGGKDSLILGAAFTFRLTKNANIRGSYDAEVKKKYVNHLLGVGIDFYF